MSGNIIFASSAGVKEYESILTPSVGRKNPWLKDYYYYSILFERLSLVDSI